MYSLVVFQTKEYNGECKDTACAEYRTRGLVFKDKEIAEAQYKDQIERAEAVIEYAKRHTATGHVYFKVGLLDEDGKPLQEWETNYDSEKKSKG